MLEYDQTPFMGFHYGRGTTHSKLYKLCMSLLDKHEHAFLKLKILRSLGEPFILLTWVPPELFDKESFSV